MKFDINVKNLGRIKKAKFKIRPITVISGPNGTGKSFFTKFLCSVMTAAENTAAANDRYSFKKFFNHAIEENFQTTNVGDLISLGQEVLKFEIKGLVNVRLCKVKPSIISIDQYLIDYFLKLAHERKITSSDNNQCTFIADATTLLNNAMGGNLIFNGDDWVFKDMLSDKEIPRNLLSDGMRVLSDFQLKLKNKKKGSFWSFDEPETNFYPDWQVKIVEVLLMMAQTDVNIVISTHSMDIIKALTVKLKQAQIEDDDFMSVHFLHLDGRLHKFSSHKPNEQLVEVMGMLGSAYEELFLSDLSA